MNSSSNLVPIERIQKPILLLHNHPGRKSFPPINLYSDIVRSSSLFSNGVTDATLPHEVAH